MVIAELYKLPSKMAGMAITDALSTILRLLREESAEAN